MATLQVAQIVVDTLAEGPGHRYALWVQGCPLRCPGCCNPHMLPFKGGATREPAELAREILANEVVEGLTVLGGEPFAQPEAVGELCALVRAGGKTTMIFSGYTLEELRGLKSAAIDALLAETDLLVDGPYEREKPETKRRWIGSTNQQMYFLTSRYSPDDPQFVAPNTVELRFSAGTLSVNGWPGLGSALKKVKPR